MTQYFIQIEQRAKARVCLERLKYIKQELEAVKQTDAKIQEKEESKAQPKVERPSCITDDDEQDPQNASNLTCVTYLE